MQKIDKSRRGHRFPVYNVIIQNCVSHITGVLSIYAGIPISPQDFEKRELYFIMPTNAAASFYLYDKT